MEISTQIECVLSKSPSLLATQAEAVLAECNVLVGRTCSSNMFAMHCALIHLPLDNKIPLLSKVFLLSLTNARF